MQRFGDNNDHHQQQEAGNGEGMRISLLVAFPMPGTLPVDVGRGKKKRREKRRRQIRP
jgi:hypothetical protein